MTAARRTGGPDTPQARDGNVVSRQVAGETLLVPIRAGAADLQHLFVLNDTAAWVWDRVDGQRTVEQLAQALVAEFEVEPERARANVERLLDELRASGLVHDGGG